MKTNFYLYLFFLNIFLNKEINFEKLSIELEEDIEKKNKQIQKCFKQIDYYTKSIVMSYLTKIGTTYIRVSYYTYDLLYNHFSLFFKKYDPVKN